MEDVIMQAQDTGMSDKIDAISLALAKAQEELESAKKDQSGYGYNYSDLASVIKTAKPVLAKNALSIVQLLGPTEGNVSVTTILAHSSGQFFKSNASLPLIDMKGCNSAQSAGASISYLRRYAYQAILGMSSEDTDASSQGVKSKKTEPKKQEVTSETKRSAAFPRKNRPNIDRL